MAAITTDLDLANAALYRCGAEKVTALADNSKSAQVVDHFLLSTIFEVARVLPWNCLIDRASMTEETSHHQNSAYAKVYDLHPTVPMTPAPLRILDVDGDSKIPFHVEGDYLYTDDTSGILRYVGVPYSGGEVNWDALLIDAMVARLASKIAFRLTQSLELCSMLVQEYITVLGIAVKVEAVETNNQDLMDLLAFMQEVNPMVLLTRNTSQE